MSLLVGVASLAAGMKFGAQELQSLMDLHRALRRLTVPPPVPPAILVQEQRWQSRTLAARQWLAADAARSPRGLSDEEIEKLFEPIRQTHLKTMNDKQAATLKVVLQKPGQRLIDPDQPISFRRPARSAHSSAQILTTYRLDDAGFDFEVERDDPLGFSQLATLVLAEDGRVYSNQIVSTAETFARARSPMSSWTPHAIDRRPIELHQWQEAAAATATAINLLLAVLLIIAGVATFNGKSNWARLHQRYAIAKVFAVLLTGATIIWVLNEESPSTVRMFATLYCVLALIYPSALLYLLPKSNAAQNDLVPIASRAR